jgi:hypothetical protein
VTVYARRSPRRDLLWTLQWPRSGRWSCQCGWACDRGSRVAGWGFLGDERYEARARAGETMTNAAMATYALDQIDQARAELNAVSK